MREIISSSEERRAQLCAQLGLSELFIDVARFCALTGFSASTVYEQIREQRFCLPVTKMGRKPYVAVEDFLDWYCERSAPMRAVEHDQPN
ncbi:hypothetical protein [Acidovorax sp.]|uniref:hypothetical protein n=1 Tax=Acidovorax sp. TaxID=1872122 RepID=UPI00258CA598|nr:hypothetical protein [Acidovorax sp.]